VVGDFDSDGDPDVAVATVAADALELFLNDGTGKVVAGTSIPISGVAVDLVAAHLDLDASLDLAVVSGSPGALHRLRSNGDGTFQAPEPIALPAEVSAVGAADVTGEGRVDLIAALGGEAPMIRFALGQSDGSLTVHPWWSYAVSLPVTRFVPTRYRLSVAGFVLLSSSGIDAGDLLLFPAPGQGELVPNSYLAFRSAAAVDLDGDGHDEVVISNARTRAPTWNILGRVRYPGRSQGGSYAQDATSIRTMTGGDFDGDGRDDLVMLGADGSLELKLSRTPRPCL
jgi:hypothetical protein